jgi:hypothetical protein
VGLAFEQHGGVDEDFSDSGQSVLEAFIQKEIEEGILLGSLMLFVHGWCCFGSHLQCSALDGRRQL